MPRKLLLENILSSTTNRLTYTDSNGVLQASPLQIGVKDGVMGLNSYQTLTAPVDAGSDYHRVWFYEIALNPSNDTTEYFPTIYSKYLHVDRDGNGGNFGGSITLDNNFLSLEGSNNVESCSVHRSSLQIGQSDGSVTPFLNYADVANFRIDVRENATLDNAEVLGLYFNADAGSTVSGVVKGLNLYANGTVEDDFYGLEINVQNVTSTSGNVYAARFFGDVSISGSLNFSGDLTIGRLNSFGQSAMIDAATNSFNPFTVHGLISGLLVAENTTTANADMIGVNTASLITAEANGVATSGPFGLGCSALALPAVVNMALGSSIQHVNACVFAVNMDASSTGGTISNLHGCRSVFIPNGTTIVSKAIGFLYDAPFGTINNDDTWGFYEDADAHNYFSGSVVVGSVSDKPESASVCLDVNSTTKALKLTPITEAQRDAFAAPVDGMIIVNSTAQKVQARIGGVWVSLH